MTVSSMFLYTLPPSFDWLIQPSPKVAKADERLKAQLLITLLLFITLTGYVSIPLFWYLHPERMRLTNPFFLVEVALLGVLTWLYYLSRCEDYTRAALGLITVMTSVVYILSIPEQGFPYNGQLNFLIVPTLLAAFFVSERAAWLLAATNVIGVALFMLVLPNVHLDRLELALITLVSASFLAVMRYKNIIFSYQQAELIKRELYYQQLLEMMPDPIMVHNWETNLYVNQAAVKLLNAPSAQSLMGHSLEELPIPPDLQVSLKEWRAKLKQLNEPFQDERLYHLSEQPPVWLEVRSAPIEFRGEAAHLVVVRDITEHKHTERQRIQLAIEQENVRTLQEIVSEISHDLKNPLTAMETKFYLLERSQLNDQQKKHLGGLREQSVRIKTLITQLGVMVKLDRTSLELVPTDLCQVLQATAEEFYSQAAEKQIYLAVDIPTNLPYVMGDEQELRRVFGNLVSNAVRYTPEGGWVSIKAWRDDANKEVLCEIKDTGIGIPAEDLEHVFERFYRSKQARAIASNGSGLGLAIVKKILNMHAAEIELESEEGKGTTFSITFPMV